MSLTSWTWLKTPWCAAQGLQGIGQIASCLDLGAWRTAYVARVFIAATIALGVSYFLQFEMPYSAATTVFLVANPIQGLTLSKGAWRVVGTILGAVIAVVLVALFAQAPVPFVLGFAIWLGICAGLSTLFRHFRGYAAAVAGYTIGLVFSRAVNDPTLIFRYAVERASAVIVGVISLSVVSALLSSRNSRHKLELKLAQLTCAIGSIAADSFGGDSAILEQKRNALVQELYALDELLEFSASESPDVSMRAPAIREAMASLFALVAGTYCPAISQVSSQVKAARKIVADALRSITADVENTRQFKGVAPALLEDAKQNIAYLLEEVERTTDSSAPFSIIALDRINELLEDYEQALTGLACLHGPISVNRRLKFRFHLDFEGAFDNGLRALLSLVLAGMIWIATAWPTGPGMILMLAILSGLLGMFGDPAAASVDFTIGITLAVIAGFICTFGLMPHVDGFTMLITAFSPFWIAALIATTYRKTAMIGTGFLLTFLTVIVPFNPMVYSVASFLNNGLAYILAGLCSVLCFKIILPRNSAADAERAAEAIRTDVVAMIRRPRQIRRLPWEHLQHQRLARIGTSLRNDTHGLGIAFREALKTIHIGRNIYRIRRRLVSNSLPGATVALSNRCLRVLENFTTHSVSGARASRRTSALLLHTPAMSDENRKTVHDIAAAFLDISIALDPPSPSPPE